LVGKSQQSSELAFHLSQGHNLTAKQEQHLGVCFLSAVGFPIIYLHLSIYCPNAASQMAAAATLLTRH
jgi:hypothetical protein